MIENYEPKLLRLIEIFMGCLLFAIVVGLVITMMITSGCVSAAKGTFATIDGMTGTPIPTPTPTQEPTVNATQIPKPTPTPIPTESAEELKARMLRTNGYALRSWHHWFREDVQGINGEGTKDLTSHATVYGYKFMPSYHYYSVSWARNFLEKPDRGYQWLFVFINIYSDGDDVRQYGYDQTHFNLHIKGETFYPEQIEYPERNIRELEETWNYAHVDAVQPYGYLITQEKGTGIISAEQQEWIMGGRSNAWDGWIMFMVPQGTEPKDCELHASFDNLAGQVWWQL